MRKYLLTSVTAAFFLLAAGIVKEGIAVEADCFLQPSVGSPVPCPADTKFSGTIVIPAATSTSLIAANVTMDPNSAALPVPGAFTRLTVLAPAAGTVNICWLGGTCSASVGEVMGVGSNVGTDTVNLTGGQAAPTFYSTAGITLSFRN